MNPGYEVVHLVAPSLWSHGFLRKARQHGASRPVFSHCEYDVFSNHSSSHVALFGLRYVWKFSSIIGRKKKDILSIVVLVSFSPPSCHLLISDDVCLVISKRISQPFQGTHTIHFLLSSLRGGLPELFFSGASRNDVHGVPGTHRPWEFFHPTDPMDPGSVPMEAGQPHIGPVHRRAGKATGGRSSILMVV